MLFFYLCLLLIGCLLISYAYDMGQAHAVREPCEAWALDPGQGTCMGRALVLGPQMYKHCIKNIAKA